MKPIIAALQERFKSFPALKSKGGKFVRGYVGQKVTGPLPQVEVTCTDCHVLNRTFSVLIEEYTLVFTIHTEKVRPDAADDIMELMITAFDDANLVSSKFKTVSMVRKSSSGPELNDDVFSSEIVYGLIIQRTVANPVKRRA